MNKCIKCSVCGMLLQGRQTLYCSSSCKNTIHQSYGSQKRRGLKRKLEFLAQLGGACSRCGYNKNLLALAFHHINPKEKLFQLDMRSLSNRTLIKVERELKKSIILCNNCHAEEHHPHLYLASESLSRLL